MSKNGFIIKANMKILQSLLFTIMLLASTIDHSLLAQDQSNLFSQESSEMIQEQYDIEEKYMEEAVLEDFRNQKAFIYDKERPPKKNGWWQMFLYKIRRFFGKIFQVESSWSWWALIKYGFFTFVILYIIRKLFGADLKNLFYNKAEVSSIEYETITENIHALDYGKDIQAAIQQGNYRKAVRLYYLKTLKVLADKEIIQWKKDKTNGDYRREVSQSNHALSFGEVTRLFDYIWYGEFPVDKPLFEQTEQKFQQFIKTIGG